MYSSRVVRVFARDALAPALEPVAVQRQQQDAAGVGSPKAGLKKVDQRNLQLAKSNGFDLHVSRLRTTNLQRTTSPRPSDQVESSHSLAASRS